MELLIECFLLKNFLILAARFAIGPCVPWSRLSHVFYEKEMKMRQKYRALIEAEICAEGKLRELAVRKQDPEKTLAEINQAAAYQEMGLAETRERLKRIKNRDFRLEAQA